MRSLALLLFGISILHNSCTINKNIAAEHPANYCVVNEDLYALKLLRLSRVVNDSMILNDCNKAVTYLELDNIESTDSRQVIYRNGLKLIETARLRNQQETKMIFDIWIDRKGNIVASKFNNGTTALIDEKLRPEILSQVLSYKYSEDLNASSLSSEKIIIILNKINAYNNR